MHFDGIMIRSSDPPPLLRFQSDVIAWREGNMKSNHSTVIANAVPQISTKIIKRDRGYREFFFLLAPPQNVLKMAKSLQSCVVLELKLFYNIGFCDFQHFLGVTSKKHPLYCPVDLCWIIQRWSEYDCLSRIRYTQYSTLHITTPYHMHITFNVIH